MKPARICGHMFAFWITARNASCECMRWCVFLKPSVEKSWRLFLANYMYMHEILGSCIIWPPPWPLRDSVGALITGRGGGKSPGEEGCAKRCVLSEPIVLSLNIEKHARWSITICWMKRSGWPQICSQDVPIVLSGGTRQGEKKKKKTFLEITATV